MMLSEGSSTSPRFLFRLFYFAFPVALLIYDVSLVSFHISIQVFYNFKLISYGVTRQ